MKMELETLYTPLYERRSRNCIRLHPFKDTAYKVAF